MTLDAALELCAQYFLDDAQVQELCLEIRSTQRHPLDALALAVARRYVDGDVSFEAAYRLTSSLWNFDLNSRHVPSLMRSVYEAFDEGDGRHGGDDAGTDPALKYTRPALAKILANASAA